MGAGRGCGGTERTAGERRALLRLEKDALKNRLADMDRQLENWQSKRRSSEDIPGSPL